MHKNRGTGKRVQKLKGLQKMIAQNKNRERSREKNKDMGQSL